MWFTETPWPPIFICGVAAFVLLLAWFTTMRGAYLLAVAGLGMLSVAIYFVERLIVTEAERVEAAIHALASTVESNDVERILPFIAEDNQTDRDLVRRGMKMARVESTLRITDVQVEMNSGGATAVSRFRANGHVTGRPPYSFSRHVATRWRLTWKRDADGEWKVTRIERLDLYADKPIDPLSAN